ncbi:MAG: ATP-binding protein [Methylohalobius sp.]|nr:ATP-binding protein [Methylohalobius sp.]
MLLSIDSADAARANLNWLFVLRNLLILATSLILVIAVYDLGAKLPTNPLWGIIATMLAGNCLTWLRLQEGRPVVELELFLHLCLDALCISGLLYFAGGATNPMAWFLLLPLIITATVLPQRYTWYMMLLVCSSYTLLIFHYHPLQPLPVAKVIQTDRLPLDLRESHQRFELHVFGTWAGFVFSAGLVAYFVVEMANTLRERERKLAEVREQALRDERVVALGTLAAGAAHEIGTPLGTMAILVQELLEDYAGREHEGLRRRLLICKDQIERCKNALAVMSASAGEVRAESGHAEEVHRYLEKLVQQWRQQRPGARLQFKVEEAQAGARIVAERTLSHALLNILNNAADVSPQAIELRARWSQSRLELSVIDQGPGISVGLTRELGQRPVASSKQGLGVGLFLAYTTVERLGGVIVMESLPQGGTQTRITLPLLTSAGVRDKRERSSEVALGR